MIKNSIDEEYINEELDKFFITLKNRKTIKSERLAKYKTRFYNEMNKKVSYRSKRRTEYLSLGKKIEILCTYTNHMLIKTTNHGQNK